MLKTAESVTPKHPDKICDQISDALLDAYLSVDPMSRVAIEAMGKGNLIYIAGEVTSTEDIDITNIVKSLPLGLDNCEINLNLTKQSNYIAQGVDTGGAGDQGIMRGYATSETELLIPSEVELARNLAKRIYEIYPYDGKTQVTVEDGRVKTVVASFQKAKAADLRAIIPKISPEAEQIFINPAGDWETGGFVADTGLTGRKIVIDNYGPQVPVGGGAFSGKDPTKVDRSAAYMARKIAVDYLRQKGAREVYVELAYSIGVKKPVQATATIDGAEEIIRGYDLTPQGIIEFLDLRKPQYFKTAQWGHFGNNFKWDTATVS